MTHIFGVLCYDSMQDTVIGSLADRCYICTTCSSAMLVSQQFWLKVGQEKRLACVRIDDAFLEVGRRALVHLNMYRVSTKPCVQ